MSKLGKERAPLWGKILYWIVLSMLIIGTSMMYNSGENTKGFMGILTIAVIMVIAIGQKYCWTFTPLFVSILYGFIFVAVGLGTFGGGYKVPHFDDFLHILSGIWIAYGSWIILKRLAGDHLAGQIPNSFIGLYMICFALAAAGVWELLEFGGDKLFHFTAQGRDPDDTMFDMIDGLVGGGVTMFIILIYRRRKSE